MVIKFKSVRGTKDILSKEVEAFRNIESKAQEIFAIYGYRQIRIPIIEPRDLFIRSLGKDTEIVGKQMFIVERADESIALRPEATAGVVRAYLQNNLYKTEGFVKLYYIGPMFRAERPQKGRLRQFHHIGVEAIGSDSTFLDAEVISLADSILKQLGIYGYSIKINSLGCLKDKRVLSEKLRQLLKNKVSLLCSDCQQRLNRNVFRVLDCKNNACKKIVLKLNIRRRDYLCGVCFKHFEAVMKNLKTAGVKYQDCLHLVRGLDYYTRTVFEIVHPGLGSQDALCAGGRYDNLVEQLGGESTGAIGFAFGIERLIILLEDNSYFLYRKQTPQVYIVTLTNEAKKEGFKLLQYLRINSIPCEFDFENRSLKSQMRSANNLGVKFVIVLGENELKTNTFSLKNMQDGSQETVKREEIIKKIKSEQPRLQPGYLDSES